MAAALQILGFGSISVDDIIYVDQPLARGKGKITKRITEHGGNVATALVAAARLGGRAGFIGWLNDQPPNDASARELERQGVDISFAPRRPDAKPIQAVITVGPDGERFIAYDDGVPHGTSLTLADGILRQARVLMIDGHATHALEVVARARELALAVVADIERSIGSATDALMSLVTHPVLPLGFGQTYTGESSAAAILDKLWSETRAAVVLTDGERGAFLKQKGDAVIWHIPAHRVTAIDTTGAGDCFHGAFAFALAEGKQPLAAALYANAAAAISVTGRGGRSALPDHNSSVAKMKEDAIVPKAFI